MHMEQEVIHSLTADTNKTYNLNHHQHRHLKKGCKMIISRMAFKIQNHQFQ